MSGRNSCLDDSGHVVTEREIASDALPQPAAKPQGVVMMWEWSESDLRVRFQIIGHARIKNVGRSQSCMVSELSIMWKQTVAGGGAGGWREVCCGLDAPNYVVVT